MMIMILTILSTVSTLLILVSKFMKPKKMTLQEEKTSPFECGFDPSHKQRAPLSLHFFILTIIFLIFDVEVTIMLPTPLLINSANYQIMLLWHIMLWSILTLGLMLEWKQGSLDWTWKCI